MKRSLNEVQRICQKAVEGAGAPAGLDTDAAEGAAWLLARDLPALDALAADLGRFADLAAACRFDRSALGSNDTLKADEKAGAVIAPLVIDLLLARAVATDGTGRLRAEGLTAPLFLLPPAVGHARDGWGFHLALTDGEGRRLELRVAAGGRVDISGPSGTDFPRMLSAGGAWAFEGTCAADLPDRTEGAVLRNNGQLETAAARSLAEGVAPDPEAWAKLQVHAAKVLVPATEQSHRLGAGALGSDNE